MKQLSINLKLALWSKSASEEGRVPTTATAPAVRKELRKGTHKTPSTLPINFWLLDVNGCIPENIILDMGVVTPMFSKAFSLAIDMIKLTPTQPFFDTRGDAQKIYGGDEGGGLHTLQRHTTGEAVLSQGYGGGYHGQCALLGMAFVARVGGDIDTSMETFYYRYEAASVTQMATLPAPCHTHPSNLFSSLRLLQGVGEQPRGVAGYGGVNRQRCAGGRLL